MASCLEDKVLYNHIQGLFCGADNNVRISSLLIGLKYWKSCEQKPNNSSLTCKFYDFLDKENKKGNLATLLNLICKKVEIRNSSRTRRQFGEGDLVVTMSNLCLKRVRTGLFNQMFQRDRVFLVHMTKSEARITFDFCLDVYCCIINNLK